MGNKTGIEWTDATWNPVVGCSVISPGCTNCYAMKMAARLEAMGQPIYRGLTRKVNGKAVWTGKVELSNHGQVIKPLSWKRPRRIFVNSMSDLFHENLPDDAIDQVFAVMALAQRHTFQILTKRPARMMAYMNRPARDLADGQEGWSDGINRASMAALNRPAFPSQSLGMIRHPGWPLPNVWPGVSVEDQQRADERIPLLLDTPAAVRFISAEPLLGPVDLTNLRDLRFDALHGVNDGKQKLDWVIAGGESGPGARPCHPDWIRALRDQCATARVPFFFKQWGEWGPYKLTPGGDLGGDCRRGLARIVHPTGQSDVEVSEATGGRSTIKGSRYRARVGKKAAGAMLDGREHREFPDGPRAA